MNKLTEYMHRLQIFIYFKRVALTYNKSKIIIIIDKLFIKNISLQINNKLTIIRT